MARGDESGAVTALAATEVPNMVRGPVVRGLLNNVVTALAEGNEYERQVVSKIDPCRRLLGPTAGRSEPAA